MSATEPVDGNGLFASVKFFVTGTLDDKVREMIPLSLPLLTHPSSLCPLRS